MSNTHRWYMVLDTKYPARPTNFYGTYRSLREAMLVAMDPNARSVSLGHAMEWGSELGPFFWPTTDMEFMQLGARYIFRHELPDPPPECWLCGNNSWFRLAEDAKGRWFCPQCRSRHYRVCPACGRAFHTGEFLPLCPHCNAIEVAVFKDLCFECAKRVSKRPYTDHRCRFQIEGKRIRCVPHGTTGKWHHSTGQTKAAIDKLRQHGIEVTLEEEQP